MTEIPGVDLGVTPSGTGLRRVPRSGGLLGWWFHLRRCAQVRSRGMLRLVAGAARSRGTSGRPGIATCRATNPARTGSGDYQANEYAEGPEARAAARSPARPTGPRTGGATCRLTGSAGCNPLIAAPPARFHSTIFVDRVDRQVKNVPFQADTTGQCQQSPAGTRTPWVRRDLRWWDGQVWDVGSKTAPPDLAESGTDAGAAGAGRDPGSVSAGLVRRAPYVRSAAAPGIAGAAFVISAGVVRCLAGAARGRNRWAVCS